jgi:Domain of unknown function (DUF4190)
MPLPPPGPPAPAVPASTSPKSSGFAIASLVLGLVWICGVGSVLAIIFGAIGLSETKPPHGKSGRGAAIAGLVIGIVGVLATVVTLILVAVTADQVAENVGRPDERDDASIVECTAGPTGRGVAVIEILNDSSQLSDYLIVVRFTTGSGEFELVGPELVDGVAPGEQRSVTITTDDRLPDTDVRCRLQLVDRIGATT